MYKTLLLSAVLSLAVVSASAQSGNFALFTNSVASLSTSNAVTPAAPITLAPGKVLALMPSYSLFTTNTGVTLTTLSFNLSFDGTLWTTTLPLVATFTNNTTGTNTVSFAVLNTNLTQNARFARLASIGNAATNALILNRVAYRFFP